MENQNTIIRMVENIERVIIGKRDKIELSLTALLAGGHLLLEDVPGVGKTTLANAIARTIDCGFTRIQFTPDTLPSDITGVSIYNMKLGKFEYSKGAIMNHIILADEINRTSPKTQASLLEAMEEGQVSVDGSTYELPKPFMVIATQNPIDYLGTFNLPEAQLDRFLMKLSIGYPSEADEVKMVKNFLMNNASSQIPVNSAKNSLGISEKNSFGNADKNGNAGISDENTLGNSDKNQHGNPEDHSPYIHTQLKNLEAVVDAKTILKMQDEVKQVMVHDDLITYIINIIEDTRKNSNVTLGASPRATLALTRVAQAVAYMAGRDYVIPDDIKQMVGPVLKHRLMMSPDARLNKQTADTLIKTILGKNRVPIL